MKRLIDAARLLSDIEEITKGHEMVAKRLVIDMISDPSRIEALKMDDDDLTVMPGGDMIC